MSAINDEMGNDFLGGIVSGFGGSVGGTGYKIGQWLDGRPSGGEGSSIVDNMNESTADYNNRLLRESMSDPFNPMTIMSRWLS